MMKHKQSKRLTLPAAGQAALKKVRRPSLPHAIKRRIERRRAAKSPLEALSSLPKITNETVAEHREEVLGTARKYIYPLQHSRDRIVKISVSLFIAALVAFFAYCGLALYKFKSTSTFIYEVTRVIPFPVAKAGPSWVSYESYLFELRHLTHYYSNQAEHENFNDKKNARHLEKLKQDSLQKVIDDAYVKQLASKNNITISNREVDNQIAIMKTQNRLGSSDQMLSDVLKQFWGWSIDDFRRQLKMQLLSQKVASTLDTATHARASNALNELRSGADFAAVANKYSDDAASKAKGGQYPAPTSKTSRDVPPQVIDALFRLQSGQNSDIIDTGYALEIVKNLSVSGDKIQGAHIAFKLQPITTYLNPLKQESKTHHLIRL